MIKFFRNQKFIAEGKLNNYLKFAIGEIVLFMVGLSKTLAQTITYAKNFSDNSKKLLAENIR